MSDIETLTITRNTTIREAMEKLDQNRGEILLVVDEDGVLLRTLSDGDVRRALLEGHDLKNAIESLRYKSPWTISVAQNAEDALEVMDEHAVSSIPQVDSRNRPIRLLRRKDFEGTVWLSSPHMGTDELRYVREAFESNWIAPLGPNVDGFEREIAEIAGVGYAAAVSSGTAALHLALVTLGVERDDFVFCQDFTFVATANPILYQGAIPVMIDSSDNNWNMSATALERALAEFDSRGCLPKAIIVANIYGQQADMDAIVTLAESYNVPLVEDAAESLGAMYKGMPSGSFGKCGVFSFNGNKIITTSGGGMMVSDDREMIEHARFLSTQAKEPHDYYFHEQIGYNYRMSNVLAGIGRGQLKVLNERVAKRRQIYDEYRAAFAAVPGLSWVDDPEDSKGTHWLSVMLVNEDEFGVSPDYLIQQLQQIGIEARHAWRPMHMQPLYSHAEFFEHAEGKVPNSRRYFETGVCLPSGSNLTDGQMARTVDAVLSSRARPVLEA